MSREITVVDYGSGNLFSVQRALEHCGAPVRFAHDEAGIASAGHLLLPGVGAFSEGMKGLAERGLVAPIRRHAASGKPLLGICLGMQMFATLSHEFGEHPGLDLIPGTVDSIPRTDTDGIPHKIPHIGWAELTPAAPDCWNGSVMAALEQGAYLYLVHSYKFTPEAPGDVLAQYEYGGHQITAAVRRGNVTGFQFHPEKSAAPGLSLLKRFIES